MFGADGHSGKRNVSYEISEAVTTGGVFTGQSKAEKSDVVFVQKDESPTNAKGSGRGWDSIQTAHIST